MLTLRIVTPERALPEVRADHVTLIAVDGQVGVRTGHAPLVALLKPGYVLARSADAESVTAVRGGVAQVFQDTVLILADAAVAREAIDVAAVRSELARLSASAPAPAGAAASASAEAHAAAERHALALAWCQARLDLPQRQISAQEYSGSARAAVDRADA